MSELERRLGALLSVLQSAEPDPADLERASTGLGDCIGRLAPDTPRAQLERAASLHACIRQLVEAHRARVAEELGFVQHARERLSRLTRPGEAAAALDVRA